MGAAADAILEDPSIESLPLKRGGKHPRETGMVQASEILLNAQNLENKKLELSKLRYVSTVWLV